MGVGLSNGYFAVVYGKPASPVPRVRWDQASKTTCGTRPEGDTGTDGGDLGNDDQQGGGGGGGGEGGEGGEGGRQSTGRSRKRSRRAGGDLLQATTPVPMYREYMDTGVFVGEFDYVEAATPHLTKVEPTAGHGATKLTITGTGLGSVGTVWVGEHECGGVVLASATRVTCTAPSVSAGRYHIKVVTPTGLAAHPVDDAEEVTYVSILKLIRVVPPQGSFAGGTLVTIHGYGFSHNTSGVAVNFAGQRARVLSAAPEQVVVASPVRAAAAGEGGGGGQPFGGVHTSPASVQIVVDADETHPGDYGQLLGRRRGVGPFNSTPVGGQLDFVWPSARTPHGGASYVW